MYKTVEFLPRFLPNFFFPTFFFLFGQTINNVFSCCVVFQSNTPFEHFMSLTLFFLSFSLRTFVETFGHSSTRFVYVVYTFIAHFIWTIPCTRLSSFLDHCHSLFISPSFETFVILVHPNGTIPMLYLWWHKFHEIIWTKTVSNRSILPLKGYVVI